MSAGEAERAEQLLRKVSTLTERLDKGREVIRATADTDTDRADYYLEHWLGLLTDYEQTVDELRRMGVSEERLLAAAKGSGT